MVTERFTAVALPHSRSPAAPFHVSVFVSPNLTPDESEERLDRFPTFRNWLDLLTAGKVILSNQKGEIDATPQFADIDVAVWAAAFPADTPVRRRSPPVWTDRHWRTFRAAEVHDTAKLLAFVSMASNPITPGKPDRRRDPLTALMTGVVNDDSDTPSDADMTRQLDNLLGETERVPLSEIEALIASSEDPLSRAFLELHRARRFYERPESAVTRPRPRPVDGLMREPLPRPVPEFHERVALVSDHPAALRRLGLVVDFSVSDLDALADSEWISADVHVGGIVGDPVRTACGLIGNDMFVTPATEEWVAGRLRLADADLFSVLDMDADGAALKTDRFLWTIPRLLAAAEAQAEATTATPAQRSAGFTIVRHQRAVETQNRMEDQHALGAKVTAGAAPLLHAEDVTHGYRFDVYDDHTNRWHTVHARRVDVDVLGHGSVIEDGEEEGFAQTTTATETVGADESPVHVHEAVASWGGWSLAAPRPGNRVRHVAGDERVEDPDTNPDEVTPIVFRNRVERGTLPRLRYGRSYSFRAWGVDLAGNSRPREVGPAPQVPPDLAARIEAGLGPAGDFRPTPGLESELRGEAAAAFIRRRTSTVRRRVFDPGSGGRLTGSAAADGIVVSRLSERRRRVPPEVGGRVDRAALVERAFEEVVLDVEVPMFVDPVFHDPIVVAGAIDIGDELVPDTIDTVTPLRPYLRWEPVQPPTVVARHPNSPGESLLQMVIRSQVVQDPDTLEVTVTLASDADAFGYGSTSERHLAPPKSSQSECELHGVFDEAIGSTDPADHDRLLAVAIRESGTWFDTTVPRLDDPTVEDDQLDMELVADPGTPASTLKTLPLDPGEPPAPGQYIVHRGAQPRVPYLPDPVARGVSLVFPEAGTDRALIFPFGVEGFTARYGGDWPELGPYRLVLAARSELKGRVDGNAIEIGLPPGDVQRVRVSSALARDDLELFGVWRSLPAVIRDQPDVESAAADGWLWALTPFDQVTMVHAVPRPIEPPRPTMLVAARVRDSVDSWLIGGVDIHGPSTEQLTAEAAWTEFTDDVAIPIPQETAMSGVAFTTAIRPEEDVAVLVAGDGPDEEVEVPGFGPVWLHEVKHRWGDTKHRNVRYTFRADTRFREYFEPGQAGSVVGPTTELSVPSSAPPAAPIVDSVIPLMRWRTSPEPEQPFAVRRERRSGLRMYLERPWYSSGEGELLAVLLAPLGVDAGYEDFVSQWGADPVWLGRPVERRGMFLEFDNLMRSFGLDDRPADESRPVAPPVTMPYPFMPSPRPVTVLGYRPRYNSERELWYVDVAIDPADRIWPFVRLTVARYQPDSINGCHLSAPVRCDFVQLLPERTASVSRTDDRHVRVVVSGAVGLRGTKTFPPPAATAAEAVARNRRLVARLQRVDPLVDTDLGWETVDTVELALRGAGTSGSEGAWVGELEAPEVIPVATPGAGDEWRIVVEEWERLLGDRADLGGRGPRRWEHRLVYADEVTL